MPVSRLPVVHKFGIISPSHRIQLQERLTQKSQLLLTKNERLIKASRNPLEVTDEFLQLYNITVDQSKKEKLEQKAAKLLEKLKHRCGLRSGGLGNHVDLVNAWTELMQLSQCKGRIQLECLDVLLVSLDQSPASEDHVPVLFFLAESVLYLLRTDVIYEQFLDSLEARLLLIGRLVFGRLFFHHMCGHMTDCEEPKRRLRIYLDGFLDSQKVYKPYPNLLCHMRFMSAAGNIIVGEQKDEPTKADSVEKDSVENRNDENSKPVDRSASGISVALSSNVHELAPTLWHSLDVWRCACHLGAGLAHALDAILECSVELHMENWIDVTCALEVLGSAAQVNVDVLTALQRIACGVRAKRFFDSGEDDVKAERQSGILSHLPAISESDLSFRSNEGRERRSESPSHPGSPVRRTRSDRLESEDASSENASARPSEVEDRDSDVSSLLSNQKTETASSGLLSWKWELALKYVDILTRVALYGSTSQIRRQALMGNNTDTVYIHHTASIVRSPLLSAGLFDMLYFRTAVKDEREVGKDDWGWRLRFAAFLRLSQIHVCLTMQGAPLGVRTVIWKMLEKARLLEDELKVLEALKVAQIDVNLEVLIYNHLRSAPSDLGSKFAHGLSLVYLPPLPPLSGRLPATARTRRTAVKDLSARRSNRPTQNMLRTSLREEILLASLLHRPSISFEERTDEELKTVIKNQWHKELLEKAKEEQRVKFNVTNGT